MDGMDDVSVLIVDDQKPFRDAARTVVRLTGGFTVVGEAGTAEEALAVIDDLKPDLVLMDINMPGVGGLEGTRRITTEHPDVVVVLLSTYAREDLPSDATACGARTYVNKEDFGPALLRQIWTDAAAETA